MNHAMIPVLALLAWTRPLPAQQDPAQLKAELLKEVEKMIRAEEERILKELEKLIDEELAKIKPAETPKKSGGLGIYIQVDFSDAEREKRKVPAGEGVYVSLVYPGGPAEKAGLKEGDLILSINGEKVLQAKFKERMAKLNAGDKVKISVQHKDGTTSELTATLDDNKYPLR